MADAHRLDREPEAVDRRFTIRLEDEAEAIGRPRPTREGVTDSTTRATNSEKHTARWANPWHQIVNSSTPST